MPQCNAWIEYLRDYGWEEEEEEEEGGSGRGHSKQLTRWSS